MLIIITQERFYKNSILPASHPFIALTSKMSKPSYQPGMAGIVGMVSMPGTWCGFFQLSEGKWVNSGE